MQNLDVSQTAAAWSSLAGRIYVPHSEEEYRQVVALLDSMIDEVGENESHPLASRNTKMSMCRSWRMSEGLNIFPKTKSSMIV